MIQTPRRTNKYYTDYDLNSRPNGHHDPIILNYANYYIIEDLLNKDEVKELQELTSAYDALTDKGTVMGYSADEAENNNMRDSNIFFLDNDPEYKKFDKIIVDKVDSINKNIFNLDLTTYMPPQYTIYGENQHFNWHPDGPFGVLDARGLNCIPTNLHWRKLSMSLFLNDENEYKGGDFQILNYSGNPECNGIHTVRGKAGTAILFPAFAAHKVTPVTEGVRKTLIYWFCGPRWK